MDISNILIECLPSPSSPALTHTTKEPDDPPSPQIPTIKGGGFQRYIKQKDYEKDKYKTKNVEKW